MKRIIFNFIFALLIGLLLPLSVNAQDKQLVIIGNAESVPAEMDLDALKSVLLGERLRWDDGAKVVLALMKTHTPIGIETSNKLYNMNGDQRNSHFFKLAFRNKGIDPETFNTVSELEAFVARTPGAIGVLQKANDTSLKIILVNGKEQI